MDCCFSTNKPSLLRSLPSPARSSLPSHSRPPIFPVDSTSKLSASGRQHRRLTRPIGSSGDRSSNRRASVVVASTEASSSRCDFSSLNAPLEPKSPAGKFLSGVLQEDSPCFHVAVAQQLEKLVSERDEAVVRMNLSIGSDEACLHRKIAELKEKECQTAVEDIMYVLISKKFHEIRVCLVPKLSKCLYNNRLEIWPSKDWELESLHSFDVLDLIRDHLMISIGWSPNSNVTQNWARTHIKRAHLCQLYAASILYGYFLKSASLRLHLEMSLDRVNPRIHDMVSNWISQTQSKSIGQVLYKFGKGEERLRYYVMGFDPESLEMFAKPKSMEAMDLIEKHSCALFGDEKRGILESEEVIFTSVASLKRLVLEAVAFGCFLWDTEEYVNGVYKLKENCH